MPWNQSVDLGSAQIITGAKRLTAFTFLDGGASVAALSIGSAASALATAMGGSFTLGTRVIFPPPRGGGLDDSANLQPVVDALSAAGGGIIEAWGTYTCNIILKAGVYIVGMNNFRSSITNASCRFNQFGAGPVIDTPTGNIQNCGVLGIAFYGLGAGTTGNGVRFQNVSAGVLKGVSANNFADEGFLTQSPTIACLIEDLFAQNCVLNRTRSGVTGAVDIDGTDHWIGRIEATASVITNKTSANLYCCGIVVRGANHKADRILGEISDQGIVWLASDSRVGLSSAELNMGHGWNVFGSGNEFSECQALSNSQDTTNTYDNWRADSTSGKNQFISPQSKNSQANITKYGFEDLVQSFANRNTYTDPRGSGSGTQEYVSQTTNGSAFFFPAGTPATLTVNSTTPDVSGYERFQTANTGPTTITDFTGGVQGQRIVVRCGDTNTTIQHNGATISLLNSGDKVLRVQANYEFVKMGAVWREIAQLPLGTSTDNGDAAKTVQARKDLETQVWANALTANRAVTLSGTGAFSGAKFHIVRKASSTGASTLDVGAGPLKSLAAGQWCDVEHDGSAWLLTAFG